jgi:hypothetical protein
MGETCNTQVSDKKPENLQGRFYLGNCDITGGKEIEILKFWGTVPDQALGSLQSNDVMFDAGHGLESAFSGRESVAEFY